VLLADSVLPLAWVVGAALAGVLAPLPGRGGQRAAGRAAPEVVRGSLLVPAGLVAAGAAVRRRRG
jgi:hypothetical protein